MTKIAHISDTHLSSAKPHFMGNWAPTRDWIVAQRPALVIHTGDVALDGAGLEDDLALGAARIADIGGTVLTLPGNHDVGLPGSAAQPVTTERLARWERHFGGDRWCCDIPGWRLLGFNAMLLGSSTAREPEQLAWLEASMASARGRRIAWFMHQPLFVEHPTEPDTGYWSVKPGPRAVLLDMRRRYHVALVASGHLHKGHDVTLDGTRYIWCPATSFAVGPGMQPEMPGEKRLGAVLYEFGEDEVTASVLALDQLRLHWIDDVVHEVYPRLPA